MKKFSRWHIKQATLLLIWGVFLVSCETEDKLETEIAQIPVTFEIERFEKSLETATPESLSDLKTKYPFLMSNNGSDSSLVAIQNDIYQQQLFREVAEKFNNLEAVHENIERLFQHLKYYDKTFVEPRVITVTSFVDYRNKNIITDSIVLIALDTYLGSEHEFYSNIPKYITQNMQSQDIVSDLASGYAERYAFQSKKKTLLDEMVFFGKLLYFKDKIIPFETEAVRMGYTQDQINWAKANEFQIWSYFIDKEMLYSTDSNLPNRFIAPAPFSKFYLELDSEAPGRLGQFIGWQMVRSYMENNDMPLLKMMQMEAEEIFKDSKYKPRKE